MTENPQVGDAEESSTAKTRYYTPDDVAMHNCAEDCWLSLFGQLTRKARPLRVVNILSRQEDQLLVACEDTIADIQERYLDYNAHAASYTWKVLQEESFVPAKMDQTLEENGIVDDDLAFEKLGIDDDGYMPVLHIYFNDDLTIA